MNETSTREQKAQKRSNGFQRVNFKTCIAGKVQYGTIKMNINNPIPINIIG